MEIITPTPALCHENHGPLLLGFGWTLLSLAVLTVALRVYFRLAFRNGMHSDDFFVVASLVSCATNDRTRSPDHKIRSSVS